MKTTAMKRKPPPRPADQPLRTPCGRIPGTPLAKVSHELTALALSYGLRAADACRRAGALNVNGSSFEPNARRLCQRPDIRERRDEFLRTRAQDFERQLQRELARRTSAVGYPAPS